MSGNQLFHTITTLLGKLFDREDADIARREHELIQKNINRGGSTDGFRHMGVIYSQFNGISRKIGSYSPLHSELVSEIDIIRSDKSKLNSDKERIRQGLSLVLRGCRSFQDIRDALPSGVKDLVPELSQLARTRPEAFTLADNPRSYKQYMAIRDKIEFYIATRLLY